MWLNLVLLNHPKPLHTESHMFKLVHRFKSRKLNKFTWQWKEEINSEITKFFFPSSQLYNLLICIEWWHKINCLISLACVISCTRKLHLRLCDRRNFCRLSMRLKRHQLWRCAHSCSCAPRPQRWPVAWIHFPTLPVNILITKSDGLLQRMPTRAIKREWENYAARRQRSVSRLASVASKWLQMDRRGSLCKRELEAHQTCKCWY